MGRRAAGIEVAEQDRAVLVRWARRPKTAQGIAQRAQIILRLGQGHSSSDVARQMQVHIQTVSKWRERFRTRGVEGLLDEPRPGQPRKIPAALGEALIGRPGETKPPAATHWSTRPMAGAAGLNQPVISRIWRA